MTENCKPDIPEGFSPSGDNINDEFEIKNLLNIYPDFELTIFNRWGNPVFNTDNYQNNWDGYSFSGVQLPDGTYYYVLQSNGMACPQTGCVQLLRH